jgi:glycosyltransferase involved in cell wall biosynthesis/SAM-dependent methyltransferase
MRVALFSPFPPQKSGIADYSAALADELAKIADLEIFSEPRHAFDPSRYDIALYQLGNNPHHAFVYEAALAHPGVAVMHEANLHHLIADLTIRRGDWDAYLREVEHDSGPAALEYARDYVRTLRRGPDYEGVPMLRRVLANSKGAIVHSACVETELRAAGFDGPVAKILHGAWMVEPERQTYRERLGLDDTTPLIGMFGFLKPYKRVAESLRAFRRLVRVSPSAKMILVGEPHPELPLDSLIQSLGLAASVRVLGFTPIEDFNGYIGACDIVLNLRYPTVGESSGTLLRSFGMGKAVVVSDVGSFAEYPDEICLKAPVDQREEDALFDYLNLLVSRPSVARALGARAREWVRRECAWPVVAKQYAEFLEAVVERREHPAKPAPAAPAEPVEEPAEGCAPDPMEAYILSWSPPGSAARAYAQTHLTRLAKTLAMTPPGRAEDRVLEMGAYLQITPALKTKLGYGEVRGCYFGMLGKTEHRSAVSEHGEEFACEMDLFNAEKDRFPYPDEHFTTVLCCELLEHLFEDPMHLMSEINRVVKPGGHVVLTTPNIASLRAIAAILQGYHPGLFHAYIRPSETGEVDARHNREYTPREIGDLLDNSGFEVTRLDTGPFLEEPKPELIWVDHLLDRYLLTREHRGDGIYVVGRKTGPVRDRYPAWLYV